MIGGGRIVSMTYDAETMTAEVHEIQNRPDKPDEEVDVCEKYVLRQGPHGGMHANFIGKYSTECATSKADADWFGSMHKVDLSRSITHSLEAITDMKHGHKKK